MASFRRYVFGRIGRMPVSEVTSGDVLEILAPVWHVKSHTGPAGAPAHAHGPGVGRGDGIPDRQPPATGSCRSSEHRTPWCGTCGLCRIVRWGRRSGRCWASNSAPVSMLAFEFLVLTAARWGEVRWAEWSEIDQTEGMWTVAGTRMKTKREHRVPLCGRAQEILEEARTLEDGAARLIFTREGGKPLGSGRLRKLLRWNGIAAVPHGFRSSFRDWAEEETDHPREGGRGGAGACGEKQGGGGVPAHGSVRAAARAHGGLGGLSGRREPASGVRPAPLIRRGGPPGRLRDRAFEPASGSSNWTAEKWGSVPIRECK